MRLRRAQARVRRLRESAARVRELPALNAPQRVRGIGGRNVRRHAEQVLARCTMRCSRRRSSGRRWPRRSRCSTRSPPRRASILRRFGSACRDISTKPLIECGHRPRDEAGRGVDADVSHRRDDGDGRAAARELSPRDRLGAHDRERSEALSCARAAHPETARGAHRRVSRP